MTKIKPLAKKHRFRRWLRRLFGKKPRYQFVDIDEMHETRPTRLYIQCPHCGEDVPLYGQTPNRRDPHKPLKRYPTESDEEFTDRVVEEIKDGDITANAARKSLGFQPMPYPDGRTIAQTIIDEVPPTDFQKRAVELLKEVAPGHPNRVYEITAKNLESLKAVTDEEHSEIHQSYKS